MPCLLFVAHADRIGVPPVMNYADYILDNWWRLAGSRPVEIGNIMQVQRLAGGLDEEWFVQIHVAIEATAGIGNDPDIGKGGTPFMKYLKKHRDANRAQTI